MKCALMVLDYWQLSTLFASGSPVMSLIFTRKFRADAICLRKC
jgi:hypothetical protein